MDQVQGEEALAEGPPGVGDQLLRLVVGDQAMVAGDLLMLMGAGDQVVVVVAGGQEGEGMAEEGEGEGIRYVYVNLFGSINRFDIHHSHKMLFLYAGTNWSRCISCTRWKCKCLHICWCFILL